MTHISNAYTFVRCLSLSKSHAIRFIRFSCKFMQFVHFNTCSHCEKIIEYFFLDALHTHTQTRTHANINLGYAKVSLFRKENKIFTSFFFFAHICCIACLSVLVSLLYTARACFIAIFLRLFRKEKKKKKWIFEMPMMWIWHAIVMSITLACMHIIFIFICMPTL